MFLIEISTIFLMLALFGFLIAGTESGAWGPVRFGEWHHFYLGAAVYIAGAVLGWPLLQLIGALVSVDDAYQHVRQVFFWDPWFHSPLTLAWLWVYERVPLVRKIYRWLEARF